eukprot:TRINITY_DN1458_c0_g1_i1.p1 TRINITY_DN1458_c0_g1~~TRINITY_DN1458_c0_g1_i1.p1  ORF type:complete len:400 (+),score=83.90 TRINITY_DN1458_c0_g1_i1:84-1283(+)
MATRSAIEDSVESTYESPPMGPCPTWRQHVETSNPKLYEEPEGDISSSEPPSPPMSSTSSTPPDGPPPAHTGMYVTVHDLDAMSTATSITKQDDDNIRDIFYGHETMERQHVLIEELEARLGIPYNTNVLFTVSADEYKSKAENSETQTVEEEAEVPSSDPAAFLLKEERRARRLLVEDQASSYCTLYQVALRWAWMLGSRPTHRSPPMQSISPPRSPSQASSPSCGGRFHMSKAMCHMPYGEISHRGWVHIARGGTQESVWVKRYLALHKGVLYSGLREDDPYPKIIFRCSALRSVENDDRGKVLFAAHNGPPGCSRSYGFLAVLPPMEVSPMRSRTRSRGRSPSPSPSPSYSPSPSHTPQNTVLRFSVRTAANRSAWMAAMRDGMEGMSLPRRSVAL